MAVDGALGGFAQMRLQLQACSIGLKSGLWGGRKSGFGAAGF
jgi:hypothetical protein